MADFEQELRNSGWEGFTGFTIKAKDTEQNQAVHDGFKEFAKVESNNDYTQALKRLLEYYQTDYKYELIAEKFQEFEARLAALEKQPEPVEAVDSDTF